MPHPLSLNAVCLDLWDILDRAPNGVAGLRQALVDGRVNGVSYGGSCACLVGTIAKATHRSFEELAEVGIPQRPLRLAERWFAPINVGDKPLALPAAQALRASENEGVWRATLALRWIDEWLGDA